MHGPHNSWLATSSCPELHPGCRFTSIEVQDNLLHEHYHYLSALYQNIEHTAHNTKMSNNNAGYDVVVDVDEEVCAIRSSNARCSNQSIYHEHDARAALPEETTTNILLGRSRPHRPPRGPRIPQLLLHHSLRQHHQGRPRPSTTSNPILLHLLQEIPMVLGFLRPILRRRHLQRFKPLLGSRIPKSEFPRCVGWEPGFVWTILDRDDDGVYSVYWGDD